MVWLQMPGPAGLIPNHYPIDDGTTHRHASAVPGPTGLQDRPAGKARAITDEERLLAAVAYGESSAADLFEEMAGIAAVVVRQAAARGQTVLQFLNSAEAKSFTFVLVDGNPRFKLLKAAKATAFVENAGIATALKAARHALAGKTDYSAGAYFWDGKDLKTNPDHPKRGKGFRFSKPEHDIYGVKDQVLPEQITYWYRKDKNGKTVKGAERGRYTAAYESTAAHGGTVFWRLTAAYIEATGNKVYR